MSQTSCVTYNTDNQRFIQHKTCVHAFLLENMQFNSDCSQKLMWMTVVNVHVQLRFKMTSQTHNLKRLFS